VHALVERFPDLSGETILRGFAPPPRFSHVRFDNYIPNAAEPSQQRALEAMEKFAQGKPEGKKGFFKAKQAPGKSGIYLDGGFGVGKTHLLGALWHEHQGKATYASFVEYTNLVGALGFQKAVDLLSEYSLVCIDEFELDDPGDTVLMSTLLQRLVENGVRLAATSNTLPDRLGEGRFAAEDFLREIQGLAAHFEIVRVDGPDYRHRDRLEPADPVPTEFLKAHAQAMADSSFDDFASLDAHMSVVHQSGYGEMISGITSAHIADVEVITHQAHALRWVVLIDRLYDQEIPVAYSGISFEKLFSEEMLKGGYRKKYLRALSRVSALSREISI
jgi:cell division protein ZapE